MNTVLLNIKPDISKDIRWAFAYFFIAVLLGIFMRSVGVVTYPFEFNYRYIVHTHSHLALLGFVYGLLSSLLLYYFVRFKEETPHTVIDSAYLSVKIRHKLLFRYRILFTVTQISVLGMLFSFPFQGYGAVSIAFSSVFVICTYFYAHFFLKNSVKPSPFVKMGIFYLILSSIGIWIMPVTIVKFGKFSGMYMCAIAFFLHFQYNGWMLSSLMGLLVHKMGWQAQYPTLIKRVFIVFQAGVLGSVFISWVGYFSYPIYYILGGLSVLLWLGAVATLAYLYFKTKPLRLLPTVFITLFILKLLMMFTGAFPQLTPYLFQNIDLLIAYLHFNFLGIILIGLLFFLEEVYKVNRWLVYLFLFAFVVTELLIAYKGFAVWWQYYIFPYFYEILWAATALFYFPAVGWLIGGNKIK